MKCLMPCVAVATGLMAFTTWGAAERAADASVWDDVKVWFKGSAGNAVGTADSGGSNTSTWSPDTVSKLKSLPTLGSGGGQWDGGSYHWWGYRLQYGTDHVKMPYAGVDLGESPCMVFPGTVTTSGWVTVSVKGEQMSRPVIDYRVGAFRLKNLLADWPADVVCTNYSCVMRFKAGEPINPVPAGNNCMKLAYFGADWNSAEGGVALSLMSKSYLSDRYCLRYTVGNDFAYPANMEFDRGQWVDLALVVQSPKISIYMCRADGPNNMITNSVFTKTYSLSKAPRPGIATNKRYFTMGSSGNSSYAHDIFTNGVNVASALGADFRGSFHQYAFWDRALSEEEVREAMGRPALVQVGLKGSAANGEFTAKKTTVAAEGDWHELNPVLTAANPSATITFQCSTQWNGLPQFLRVAARSDSDAGSLTVTLNSQVLGEVKVAPGKVGRLYIEAGKIAEGVNTLVLTRQTGTTLKMDAVTVNGSWMYGIDDASKGIGYFGYDNSTWDSYHFIPFCGADKLHIRGMGGKSTPYYFRFRVPADLAGKCKGKLYFRSQNTGNNPYKADVSVNGTILGTLTFKQSSTGTVKVPAKALKAGWNEAKLQLQSGWANMDCHRFTIEPGGEGLSILVR